VQAHSEAHLGGIRQAREGSADSLESFIRVMRIVLVRVQLKRQLQAKRNQQANRHTRQSERRAPDMQLM